MIGGAYSQGMASLIELAKAGLLKEQEPACDICSCNTWSADCECNCHAWFVAELADALEKRFPGHSFLTALLDALDETDISLERGSFIQFNGKR